MLNVYYSENVIACQVIWTGVAWQGCVVLKEVTEAKKKWR